MQDDLYLNSMLPKRTPEECMMLTRRQLEKSQQMLARAQYHLVEIRKSLETYKRISVRSQMIG